MAENESKNTSTRDHSPGFGMIAVELGYITPNQLKEALMEQKDDDLAGRPRLPIGSILYGKGWITLSQFEHVFNKKLAATRRRKKHEAS